MTKTIHMNTDGSFDLYDGMSAEVIFEDGDVIFTIFTGTAIVELVHIHRGLSFLAEDRASFISDAVEAGIAADWAEELATLAENIYDVKTGLV